MTYWIPKPECANNITELARQRDLFLPMYRAAKQCHRRGQITHTAMEFWKNQLLAMHGEMVLLFTNAAPGDVSGFDEVDFLYDCRVIELEVLL